MWAAAASQISFGACKVLELHSPTDQADLFASFWKIDRQKITTKSQSLASHCDFSLAGIVAATASGNVRQFNEDDLLSQSSLHFIIANIPCPQFSVYPLRFHHGDAIISFRRLEFQPSTDGSPDGYSIWSFHPLHLLVFATILQELLEKVAAMFRTI